MHKFLFLSLSSCSFLAVAHAQTAPATTPSATSATPSAPKATGGTPAAPTRPQTATRPFAKVGGFSISGYLRSRVENYNYFRTPGFNGSYVFSGHQLRLSALDSSPKLDFQFDLQGQLLTNLPGHAIAPAPQGALGLGANYYAANGRDYEALNIKQAFVRFKGALGTGSAARVGRFEFNDGVETVSKDPTLNFLKTQRISQRFIGTFGFSHTGRAFDGGQLSLPVGTGNFTLVGARPTTGVFQLDANKDVDSVDFLYGAYTKPLPSSEVRVFGLAYEDGRATNMSTKVDNRPLAARQADNKAIRVYTLGINYIRDFKTRSGTFDVLGLGAIQTGNWGTLKQRADDFNLEAGYQPKGSSLKPWLRIGYDRSSGDKNGADGTHGTFFTPLPTPRVYARFPFFDQLNNTDTFAQLILRPNPKANLRFEAHRLQLTSAQDLYYAGGGAFQSGGNGVNGFGFAGRPSGGSHSLANLFDASFDYTVDPKTSVGLYFGQAFGGKVIDNIYKGRDASLAFLEFSRKF